MTAVLFATACEGWVLGKRLRKAITKVQKAAGQKPMVAHKGHPFCAETCLSTKKSSFCVEMCRFSVERRTCSVEIRLFCVETCSCCLQIRLFYVEICACCVEIRLFYVEICACCVEIRLFSVEI